MNHTLLARIYLDRIQTIIKFYIPDRQYGIDTVRSFQKEIENEYFNFSENNVFKSS